MYINYLGIFDMANIFKIVSNIVITIIHPSMRDNCKSDRLLIIE